MIEYTDDGIGAQIARIKFKSGLLNIENRISAIGGTLTYDNAIKRDLKLELRFLFKRVQ